MINTQKLSKLAGIGLATSIAFLGTTNTAQALDFSFSFDDTAGANQGTVTGKITGLSDDTNDQQPATVTVDGAPSDLNFSSLPLNLNYQNGDGFDVSGGMITNASALYSDATSQIRFNFGGAEVNSLKNIADSTNVLTSRAGDGFANITYTNDATPVPFGVAPNMGIIILGGMYGASRLRKKLAAK